MTTPDATAQRVVYDTIRKIGNWVASFFPVTWLLWAKGYGMQGCVFARFGSLYGLGFGRCGVTATFFSFRSFVRGFSSLLKRAFWLL